VEIRRSLTYTRTDSKSYKHATRSFKIKFLQMTLKEKQYYYNERVAVEPGSAGQCLEDSWHGRKKGEYPVISFISGADDAVRCVRYCTSLYKT
jgi:hypothetical protein